MTVIHFTDFEDMVEELDDSVLRISTLVRTIHVFIDRPDMSLHEIDVCVRQIKGNTILSWNMPTGQYEVYNNRPWTTADEEIYERSIAEAERIQDMIRDRINVMVSPLNIKPGIIDIGTASLVLGTWSMLEVEQVSVDEEPVEEPPHQSVAETVWQESTDDDDEIPF